ncbi:mRNA cleavage and polyadenylation factor subunit, partial [Kickxella alabastrina]
MRDPTYTYCRELLAPSTVDRAVSLSFTRVGVSNLALARGNVLELYEVQLVARPDGSGGGEAADDYTYRASGGEDFGLPMIQDDAQQRRRLGNKYTSSSTKRPQLHLVSRWTLHGRIMDMQAVRGGSGGGSGGGRQRVDRLLLSFADAKMSLVAFDRATQSITTESIHYYEHDQLKQCAFNDAQTCDLRMDPDGRCVAMRIYDDQLAILPLAAPGDAPASASAPSGQSFVVDLRADGVDVRNVRDFAFLNGYLEPTLVLLHEQVPMWPGVIESARDSSVVTVVSLDLSRRCVSRLNAAGRLPYDCQTLVPVPEPIGGVLVLATNSVTHVVNGAVSCISVLNSLAMHGMGIELRATIDTTNEALGLVLDPHRSACVLVGRSTAALWTQHGFVFLLRLDGDGRLVKRIVATQISGADPRADALPPIAHEWDDIGVLPSCAVEVRIASDDGGDENSGDGGDGSGSDNALDGLLIFVGGASGRSLLLGVDQAERSLCPEPGSDSGAAMDIDAPMDIDSLRLTVHDEILGTGPVVDMEVGSLGAEDLELVTCGGNEWRGCLRVQRRHVQPEVVASFDLPGAPVRGVWTVRCLKEYRIGGVMQAADAGSLADMSDSFVVLSRDHATTVLSGGDELQQLDRTGFYTDGPTIEAGEILGSTRVVQVHARGLRLVNALGRETQSLLFDSGEAAVAAEISDPYVLVRMADDSFTMFEAPIDSGELREIIVPEALRAGSGNVVYASLFDDACRVLETNREHVDRNREAIREQLGAALAGAAGSGSSGSMPGMIGDLDDLYAETGHSQRRKPGAGRFTARKQRKRTENNPGSRDDNGEDDENDDDDFDALYDEDEGEDAGADGSVPSGKAPAESPGDTADNADGEGVRGESPMYALVALANGDLSVFRLPHFDRVWTTARFDSLADTL